MIFWTIWGFLLFLLILRFYYILPTRINKIKKRKLNKYKKCRTMIILGSGGHTTEMLHIIQNIKENKYEPIAFIIAKTDTTSEVKVRKKMNHVSNHNYIFYKIPRSREVHQSWISTIISTFIAFIHSLFLVNDFKPDLLICNGPGTCIPLCGAILFNKYIGLNTRTKIIFCESFARVNHLSLTGKFLYYFSDRFVVLWPELAEKYPLSEYIGNIC